MDNHRREGRDKPVSSYASLATGPLQSNNSRDGRGGSGRGGSHRSNYDDGSQQARGSGRGYHHSGRGRGRGRYDYSSDRFERGGRGRGRLGSHNATNSVHSDRFEPSTTNTNTTTTRLSNTEPAPSASPDRSGYESGEIMPGPPQRPLAHPRRGSTNNLAGESGNAAGAGAGAGATTTAANTRGNTFSSSTSHYHSKNESGGRGEPPPGRSLDGRGPGGRFSGRGRGREGGGGRFFERGSGGRGRGAGRMDHRYAGAGAGAGRGGDCSYSNISVRPAGAEDPPDRINSAPVEPPTRIIDTPIKEEPQLYTIKKKMVNESGPRSPRPLPPRDPMGGDSANGRTINHRFPASPDDPDRFGVPIRMHDTGGPEQDRYGKRSREDGVAVPADQDEKRPRNSSSSNNNSSSTRQLEEGRSSFPPNSIMDSRPRPVDDFRRLDHDRWPPPTEQRASYGAGGGGGPPRRDDSTRGGGHPPIRPERGDRTGPIDAGQVRYMENDSRDSLSRAETFDEPPPRGFDGTKMTPAPHWDDNWLPHDAGSRVPVQRDEPTRDGHGGYRDRDARPPFPPPLEDIPYQRQRPPQSHDFREAPTSRDGPKDGPRDLLLRDVPRDGRREMIRDGTRDIPRDTMKDGPREMPRDIPWDGPRGMLRDGPRDTLWDGPRDMSRDIPGDGPRDMRDGPRELTRDMTRDGPREMLRDGPRDMPREMQRDGPRDILWDGPRDMSRNIPGDGPRDMLRDGPRELTRDKTRDGPRDIPWGGPRDMPRDLPGDGPRDMLRDGPRDMSREMLRDGPRDMSREMLRDGARDVPWDGPRDTLWDGPRELTRDKTRDGPRDTSWDGPRDMPRDLPGDGPRDMPRDGPRDMSREMLRDGARDVPWHRPRDMSRDIPRDGPRDMPRDIPRDGPRDMLRDGPREMAREIPRDGPWDGPRDMQRDLPRDIVRDRPREMERDMPRDGRRVMPMDGPRDLPRDISRDGQRDILRDGPRDIQRDTSRGLSMPMDLPRDPPRLPSMERDFRGGDEFHGGQTINKPIWSAPSDSRSLMPASGPPGRMGPNAHFRDEPRCSEIPHADPLRPQPPFDSRGSFSDQGGMGRGGRGFQRGGMGRGRGRGGFGRGGSGGRGPNDFHRTERDGPGVPSAFRTMDSTWKARPNSGPSSVDSWTPHDDPIKPLLPQEPKQQPPQPTGTPSLDATASTATPSKIVKTEPFKTELEEHKGPRPISPPPPGKPSGVLMALARLADLEAQMEYAYAKHMQLVKQQRELQLQATILETLPLGIEAFKDELDLLASDAFFFGDAEAKTLDH